MLEHKVLETRQTLLTLNHAVGHEGVAETRKAMKTNEFLPTSKNDDIECLHFFSKCPATDFNVALAVSNDIASP